MHSKHKVVARRHPVASSVLLTSLCSLCRPFGLAALCCGGGRVAAAAAAASTGAAARVCRATRARGLGKLETRLIHKHLSQLPLGGQRSVLEQRLQIRHQQLRLPRLLLNPSVPPHSEANALQEAVRCALCRVRIQRVVAVEGGGGNGEEPRLAQLGHNVRPFDVGRAASVPSTRAGSTQVVSCHAEGTLGRWDSLLVDGTLPAPVLHLEALWREATSNSFGLVPSRICSTDCAIREPKQRSRSLPAAWGFPTCLCCSAGHLCALLWALAARRRCTIGTLVSWFALGQRKRLRSCCCIVFGLLQVLQLGCKVHMHNRNHVFVCQRFAPAHAPQVSEVPFKLLAGEL